jgi:hypothetical protein
MLLKISHIHARGISSQGQGLVRIGNFFRPDGQDHIIHARFYPGAGHVQCRRSACACIFHISDGNSADAHIAHDYLAANRMLVIKHSPEGIGKKHRLHVLLRQSCIL